MKERFRDSAGVLPDYEWEINHSDEDSQQTIINLERTAPTTGVGFVRQQGQMSPRTLNFSGSILTQSQFDWMTLYALACSTRTIFFRDVSGVEYEVLITNFSPKRQRVAWNSREPGLLWKWSYQISMEIIS